MAETKLTEAQRRVLRHAETGARVVASSGWEIHGSFVTGESWYGVPRSSHRICIERGWLHEDRITPAGRLALQSEKKDG